MLRVRHLLGYLLAASPGWGATLPRVGRLARASALLWMQDGLLRGAGGFSIEVRSLDRRVFDFSVAPDLVCHPLCFFSIDQPRFEQICSAWLVPLVQRPRPISFNYICR